MTMATEQITLDFTKGQLEKEAGLDVVQLHHAGFIKAMRRLAIGHCRRVGSVTVDDLRSKALILGLQAPHRNAWGAIFHGKDWERLNYEPSILPENHARAISRWRYKG